MQLVVHKETGKVCVVWWRGRYFYSTPAMSKKDAVAFRDRAMDREAERIAWRQAA